MRRAVLHVSCAAVVACGPLMVGALPAHAVHQGVSSPAADGAEIVDRTAAAFAGGRRVHVAPGAADAVNPATVDRVRQQVRSASRPVYVAVLPARAKTAVADPGDLPEAVYLATQRASGMYVVLTDDQSIYVGSDLVPTKRSLAIADAARAAGRADGPDAALLSAVRDSARQSSEGQAETSQGDILGYAAWGAPVLVGWLALFVSRRRSRRRDRQRLEQVRGVADEDIARLGEDLAHVELYTAHDEEMRADHEYARQCHEQAKGALTDARQPQDLAMVSAALDEGRYALTRVHARLGGQPRPEWRAPCFFNPAHGPSVDDRAWAPPGGDERNVPVCSPDFERLRRGEPPDIRMVSTNGDRRPYWDATADHDPWVSGYFAGHAFASGMWMGTGIGARGDPGAIGTSGSYGHGSSPSGGFGSGGGGGFGGGGGGFGGGGGR